jgi:hypothetical protein
MSTRIHVTALTSIREIQKTTELVFEEYDEDIHYAVIFHPHTHVLYFENPSLDMSPDMICELIHSSHIEEIRFTNIFPSKVYPLLSVFAQGEKDGGGDRIQSINIGNTSINGKVICGISIHLHNGPRIIHQISSISDDWNNDTVITDALRIFHDQGIHMEASQVEEIVRDGYRKHWCSRILQFKHKCGNHCIGGKRGRLTKLARRADTEE